MKIGTYTIDLPISSDYPYQLLYKGRDQSNQSLFVNVFPKIELDQIMYDSISKRIPHYSYIKEAIEDDTRIYIFYQLSSNWVKMPTKITNKQFNQYVKQLYNIYLQDGTFDFKYDHIYCNEQNVFVLDYGLAFLLQKQKFENIQQLQYNQNELMKTWMFGSLIYCLSTGVQDPSPLIKLDQNSIDFYIEYNCRANCISEENIDLLKLMLRVDFDTRPAFDQLQNHPLLKINQRSLSSIVSNNNTKQEFCKTLQKFEQIENNSQQQFHEKQYAKTGDLTTVHHQSIKFALKQSKLIKSTKTSSYQKLNQFQYASQIIKSKLSKSKSNNIIKGMQTTESFFQNDKSTAFNQKQDDSSQSRKPASFRNLQLNMEVVKQSNSESSQQKKNIPATNQIKIDNKKQFQQKPKGNQINSFDLNFLPMDEEDEPF